MVHVVEAPSYEDLVEDLKQLRQKGITELRRLDLPALATATKACGEVPSEEEVKAPALEAVVRRGIQDLDGDRLEHVAGLLFLVSPGSRDYRPAEARRYAADEMGLSIERFRREPEQRVIGQVAEMILNRIHDHHMQLARLDENRRTPDSTRLAVKWLERFDAYYRIWTPINALGGDLTAYRSTLLDRDRPFDRVDSDGDEYNQEIQAVGYVTTALFDFASYLEGLRRLGVSHGGHWLLSDAQAGREVADAIYRIGWHSPNNTRDDSFLRSTLRDAAGEEHGFLNRMADSTIGMGIHEDWQEWADECECEWEHPNDPTEYFPTRRNHTGINQKCGLHLMVEACGDYCRLIDEDMFRLQDWYSIDQRASVGVSGEELFKQYPVKP